MRGQSKETCLFTSLTIRDFLVEIGFKDATVRGCGFYITAVNLWSLGLGTPGQPDTPDKFNGHAVVIVPSLKLMIDSTLYQAQRPQWNGALSGMMAIPYHRPDQKLQLFNRPVIAGYELSNDEGVVVSMVWIDRPELQWKKSQDFRVRNARRRHVTLELVKAYTNKSNG